MKILKTMPGIALSMAIAFLALWLESLLPIHVVGASVIAMFIGMTLNYFLKNIDIFNATYDAEAFPYDMRLYAQSPASTYAVGLGSVDQVKNGVARIFGAKSIYSNTSRDYKYDKLSWMDQMAMFGGSESNNNLAEQYLNIGSVDITVVDYSGTNGSDVTVKKGSVNDIITLTDTANASNPYAF